MMDIMDIFDQPSLFLHFLEFKHGPVVDDVYAAMKSRDLSDVVMAVLNILKNHMGPTSQEEKSEYKSDSYRKEGNSVYVNGDYHVALKLYNKALMYAPNGSMAMKLAYSNRSALLFKISNYSACSKDIEMCLDMGCPSDITEKLLKRKADLTVHLWAEKKAEASKNSKFCNEFFKIHEKRNPDIPCASRDLKVVIMEKSSEERVIATKDINVGTVLAIETAFSHEISENMKYYSCYYCSKVSLNLIPCDGCCCIMFCNKDCKELCMSEGHDIECQFIEDIAGDLNSVGARISLALKSALKIKKNCKSWNEFISVSHGFDCEGLNQNVTDVNEKFPILTNQSIVDFPYGLIFRVGFLCAIVINKLDNIQSFFPKRWNERQDAMRAFSRVVVYLSVYANRTVISSCGSGVLNNKDKVQLMEPNVGHFSFVGKLKHSCTANTLAVGLNNKIALVAVQSIKCGTEVTITNFGQYHFDDRINAFKMMFSFNKSVCHCTVTKGDYELSHLQKNNLRNLNLVAMEMNFNQTIIPQIFRKLCESLDCLSNLPHSNEYKAVYDVFSKCIIGMQDLHLGNQLLSFD